MRVKQPLGTFYVASISARKLLGLCYSDPAELRKDGFHVDGTQRLESVKRLREISEYICTHEAAFPNAIILGANYDRDGVFVDDPELTWKINASNEVGDGEIRYRLIIPTDRKLASIIDGQHRLKAFNYCEDVHLDMELLCAIYLDLPIPYHAYLFSTINFNQKKVDRSLAYNLFGFDIESASPSTWVPETLAVSLARRLNIDETPFHERITLGVINNSAATTDGFTISMATIVDGILKLISKNPKKDRTDLMQLSVAKRDRQSLLDDGSPLRFMYREGYDEAIYEIIKNYFSVIEVYFWNKPDADPYISKTVGIQALFDVLAKLLVGFEERLDGEYEEFYQKLSAIENMKFEGAQASGKGRASIKNKILEALNII